MTQNMFFLCCPFAVRLPPLPSPCQPLTLSAMQKWQLHWRLRPEAFLWLVGIVTIATAVIVIHNTYLNFYCVRHYWKHFINEETEALRDFGKERGGKGKKPPHGLHSKHVRLLDPFSLYDSASMEDTEAEQSRKDTYQFREARFRPGIALLFFGKLI